MQVIVYRLSGTGAAGGGRSGDLSADIGAVIGAESQVVGFTPSLAHRFVYVILKTIPISTGPVAGAGIPQWRLRKLPSGVTPHWAGCHRVGWVYQYALVAKISRWRRCRLQDWTLRYPLSATPGVAEVASVGMAS